MADNYHIQESLSVNNRDPYLDETSNANLFRNVLFEQKFSLTCSPMEDTIETKRTDDEPNFSEANLSRSHQMSKPKYPGLSTEGKRLTTYKTWPKQMRQTPQELTNAGLFFTGNDDCVCCFFCGGHIRQWLPNDDPWNEHCRFFPFCPFVWKQKGEQFINQAFASSEFENEMFYGPASTNGQNNLALENYIQRSALEEKRSWILQMGYTDSDFLKAFVHLRNLGIMKPSVNDIISTVAAVTDGFQDEMTEDACDYEQSLKENQRLKKMLYCMVCKNRVVGILFLPCGHNKTCADCGEHLLLCPYCQCNIREKIATSFQ